MSQNAGETHPPQLPPAVPSPKPARGKARLIAILVAVVCAWLPQAGHAQGGGVFPCGVIGAQSYAEESIVVSTTSVGFTTATYSFGGPTVAFARVQLQTDSVYARDTGAAATNTAPVLSTTNTAPYFYVCGQNAVQKARFLRVTNDATLRVTYFGN